MRQLYALMLSDTSRIQNNLLAAMVKSTFLRVACLGLKSDCRALAEDLSKAHWCLKAPCFNSKAGIIVLPPHGVAVKIK